jgi:2-aminoethylphosphonate-pyruvate transaminase
MILLNPGPANTSSAVKQALLCDDICPREREFGDVMRMVCEGLVRLVDPGDEYTAVLFGGSGTAAVEAAIASAVPADGRLLVIDNGAYGARMVQIAEAYRLPHDVEVFGVGGWIDIERIAQRLVQQSLTGLPYTQLAVVHHETTTGMLNPVEAIGALCREHGVELIVDAMSSYAGIPFSMNGMGADFLVASANKCIQGMAGLSFVICRRRRVEAMTVAPGRSLYLDLGEQYRYFERCSQMRFTPPVQLIYALAAAIDELEVEGGVVARHLRYQECWRALDGGMQGLGFRRLLPEHQLSRILTSYIEPTHEDYSYGRLHDLLYGRGFTIYPGKGGKKATFRLANMGNISPGDMDRFIAAMRQTVTEMGLDPLYRD